MFGSARCDCGPQPRETVERIENASEILLYLRQEGRGIGLDDKPDAYAVQNRGLDTSNADTALGPPEDARVHTAAVRMHIALGIIEIDLPTNNPDKARQLTGRLCLRDRTHGSARDPEQPPPPHRRGQTGKKISQGRAACAAARTDAAEEVPVALSRSAISRPRLSELIPILIYSHALVALGQRI